MRGTQNVVEAAIDASVEKVLTISTDKAVDPTNVMGATKLLAERLMSAAETYKGASATRFAAVRFGNVIGSRGSIVPLVRGQVARGGPVTVTDPEMTRYLMPIADAVRLCFMAIERMTGGEVFILKMPRVRMGDLMEVLVETYAPANSVSARSDMRMEVIGARAGEKSDELLMTPDESRAASELDDMFVVNPRTSKRGRDAVHEGTGLEPPLDRDQLRELLDAAGWLRPESLPTLG